DRLLAVDDDLTLVVDLGRAEAPRHRIRPAVGIAQTVAKGLTHREVLLLERGAYLPQLVPGVGEFVRTDLLQPVLAVVPDAATHGEGNGLASAVHHVDLAADVVVAAVPLGNLLRYILDIGKPIGVEMGPVVDHHDDVRAGLGLDGGGDPGIEVVHVDQVGGD